MEISEIKSIIEAMLFASGRDISTVEIASILELTQQDVEAIIESMKTEFEEQKRGVEIIKLNEGYQMATKKEYYEYIYPLFDNRNKPNLSNAALETLSIIAYNPRITRAQIEAIRGVNSDGTVYKLLEYNLIEEAGKLDAPGRPSTYVTTKEFLKTFGLSSIEELPELPKYKLDENEQIVLEEIMPKEEQKNEGEENNNVQDK